ncbi:MAG: alpha/beta hydrolase [Chloroflexi bacterium]|nr:alpha/beta hydrolase [Chloroflexota bacterium]
MKAHVGDLAAVVDELELAKFDLVGDGEGASVCVAYAAQNPERISHLALWSLCAWGQETVDARGIQALLVLIRDNWSMARRTMADSTYPSGPIEFQRWWANRVRQSMSSDVAARYLEFLTSVDIKPYLPQVEAPTLVLHRRDSRIWPISDVRAAAAMIRTCTFVLLDGDISDPLLGDISYLETVRAFLDDKPVETPGGEAIGGGAFRTILFTDVEGSTALTDRHANAIPHRLVHGHGRPH